jgi:hypothetical protein
MLDVRNIQKTEIQHASNFGIFKCQGRHYASLYFKGFKSAQSVHIFSANQLTTEVLVLCSPSLCNNDRDVTQKY